MLRGHCRALWLGNKARGARPPSRKRQRGPSSASGLAGPHPPPELLTGPRFAMNGKAGPTVGRRRRRPRGPLSSRRQPMAERDPVHVEDVLPVGSRVSWAAVFAGAVVALAIYLVLALL